MATIVSIRDIRWYIDGIWIPNNQLVAPHNKYTVGYCNPYGNVAVLSMRICKIDGRQDIIQLMIGFLCHLAREREDSIYTQQSTAIKRHNNILLIGYAIHVGMWVFCMRWSMGWKDITIRVCYCCQVYNVWGKCQMAGQDGGTITTKTGMLAKRTLLQ